MNKYFLALTLISIFISSTFSQNTICLKVLSENSSRAISFAKIKTKDSTYLSDICGELVLSKSYLNTPIEVSQYPFLTERIVLKNNNDTTTVKLQKKDFDILNDNENNAHALIEAIELNKKQNDPLSYAPFYSNTYNKFYIETNKVSEAKSFVDKFIHSFSIALQDYKKDHFILLTESTTERRYLNKVCEDETVLASKVSGIQKPLLLTMNSQLLPFSFYENYLDFGGKSYTNPLANNPSNQYNFKVIDTVYSTYTVIFSPKKKTRFEGLKGILYIDSKTKAITKAIYQPSKETKNIEITLIANFKRGEKDLYLPYHIKTIASVENVGNKHLSFLASASTVYSKIILDTAFNKNEFDEYAIKYSSDTLTQTDTYWKDHRKLSFTDLDKNTYAFYDTVGSIKNFENLVYTGERIAYKKVPYKFIDFDLRRLIGLNRFEGLRLGLGLETNEKLNENIRIGGFFGYGFKDRLFKFGIHSKYYLQNKQEGVFTLSYSNDVHESGGHKFFMDKYQYSSEWLRKLRIAVMEQVKKYSFSYSFNPIKFLYLNIGVSQSQNTIYDNYRFINLEKTNYKYSEVKISTHYQFGQRYLKLLNDRYPFKQMYPHLWIEYTKGLQIDNLGDFDYHKIEFKVNYNHKFLNLGTSGIEISGGWVNESIPYYKLFNGKGSAEISTVAHNSFETMGYNEFFSDSYLALFYSHDFGYWNFFYNPNFRPRLEVAYNMGIGGLRNRSNHKNINYESFDQLYMEAGFLINNLLTANITAIKAGFGMGIYYRFGPLQNPTFVENTFLKISTTFNL